MKFRLSKKNMLFAIESSISSTNFFAMTKSQKFNSWIEDQVEQVQHGSGEDECFFCIYKIIYVDEFNGIRWNFQDILIIKQNFVNKSFIKLTSYIHQF